MAVRGGRPYINVMRRFLPIAIVLVLILVAAIVLTLHIWNGIGDGGMSGQGVMALILGVVGSLVLGGGLMALVFISARKGYDDAADAANQIAHEHDKPSSEP